VGSNGLLAEGARPLVSIEAFVRDSLGVDPEATRDCAPGAVGDEALILSCFDGGTRSVDEVARSANLSVGRVLSLLSELELRGRVERMPGMRFRRGESATRRAPGSA
jgi:predicted Rossmann fold nucleotide-binding protein DprA/Smf involved in DNA uptake